jgi:hypothetical protein
MRQQDLAIISQQGIRQHNHQTQPGSTIVLHKRQLPKVAVAFLDAAK